MNKIESKREGNTVYVHFNEEKALHYFVTNTGVKRYTICILALISNIPELPPVTLPPSVPAPVATGSDIMQYDKVFLNTGGGHVSN